MSQSAMPVMCRVLVPEVLPVVLPVMPAVPEVLPAAPPDLVLPGRLPADLPPAGRAALAAALAGAVPGGRQRDRGDLVRAAGPACWDEGECARLPRFLDAVDDPRDRRGRAYPLRYLLALPLAAGMAGDDELDAAGEWIASAPEEVLLRLGAPRDRAGRARRPDAATIGRILGAVDQCQYDDALCAWAAARARAQRPGLRKHLRVDGKALRGARRGGRAPMLLSGIWDDGTTAAQRPVDVKTNEVRREALCRIPDSVRRNPEGSFWTRWLTRIRKVRGTRACHEYLRSCPKTRNEAQGSPRDMAKARLPESQSPVMQVFIRRKWSLKPVPRAASCYLVGDATSGVAGDAQ